MDDNGFIRSHGTYVERAGLMAAEYEVAINVVSSYSLEAIAAERGSLLSSLGQNHKMVGFSPWFPLL